MDEKDIQLTTLNRKEALRYMGYKNINSLFNTSNSKKIITDFQTKELLDAVEKKVFNAAQPKYTWRLFSREQVPLDLLTNQGNDIVTHLQGCTHIVFLCATIGPQIDRLIRKLQITDMAQSIVADSLSSVAVEQVCDKLELKISDAVEKKLGKIYLTFRFSCGYGDFPLAIQNQFLSVLDATRQIGVTVTEGGLMAPIKSVSAVIGISKKPVNKQRRNCKSCSRYDTCKIHD
ncbi:MAG: hypothetical protein BKP49_11240 [Treponema sp. CETP13]|nr:MAG: hypothetical protein BKP49_11240 [Treponema sp. CETP13]